MLGEILAIFFLILTPGCILILFNDFLARRRNEEFLCSFELMLFKRDKKE